MLNAIWVLMLVVAVVVGAATGRLDAVAKASTDSAKSAVELAIGLVGVMAFWLGLMRVLQEAGALRAVARALRPIMTRLFPQVPADHPAMSAMIMNMTSNLLGLGNAATPFGLKAMMELDKLNPHKGTATNAMALFLAINTSGLALLPTGVIALRSSLGSASAGSILLPTLIATAVSTLTAIVIAKTLEKMPAFAADTIAGRPVAPASQQEIDTREAEAALAAGPPPATRMAKVAGAALALVALGAFGYALYTRATGLDAEGHVVGWSAALQQAMADWLLLVLIAFIVIFGVWRGTKAYDAVVEGGKEGFQVAIRIIPFLVAILVAVGMLRASGAIDAMVSALEPLTALIGMPAEALPMALLRPLSGSGAYGVAADIMKAYGPDSLVGNIVSTMQGSTETTFYVLALYFGAVAVRNARHTVLACLAADVVGLLMATWACLWLLG